jgi:hypothetical protein
MTERSDKMSVIGRLDEQVEAVLINPLRRERLPDEETRERTTMPAPATEERDAESIPEPREADASLPVWLL